jgi:hypothetical protein
VNPIRFRSCDRPSLRQKFFDVRSAFGIGFVEKRT